MNDSAFPESPHSRRKRLAVLYQGDQRIAARLNTAKRTIAATSAKARMSMQLSATLPKSQPWGPDLEHST